MRATAMFPAFKVLSWIVLLSMLAAAGYTFFVVVMHGSGIGV